MSFKMLPLAESTGLETLGGFSILASKYKVYFSRLFIFYLFDVGG